MEDQAKDDESLPELDDWLAAPFTKRALEKVKKEVVPALLEALLRHCGRSTDPGIQYWYARYVDALAVEDFLTKGELKT